MKDRTERRDGWNDALTLDTEEREWVSTVAVPHRYRLTHAGPYRAAVPPSIASYDAHLPHDLAELVTDATAEIARFDADHGAAVAPFASILLRSESVASSRIENLTASAKAIALAELGDSSRANATLIVANVDAMRAAIALASRLDEQAVLDMHTALLGHQHPEWCGRWRDQQVWIGGSSYGPHGATFVPPHHERVPAAMQDLLLYLRRTDEPVLVQAAIAHAQFETIHPFPDGNGRTGRALIHSLLRHRALTRSVTLPISAGLLTDTDRYFAALMTFRAGDPTAIVRSIAEASHHAVHHGRLLITTLTSIRAQWASEFTARSGSGPRRLADLLLRQPAVDSTLVERELGVSRPTALHAIDVLETAGVLRQATTGKWGRKWVAPDVLAALDSYAAGAGRRTRA